MTSRTAAMAGAALCALCAAAPAIAGTRPAGTSATTPALTGQEIICLNPTTFVAESCGGSGGGGGSSASVGPLGISPPSYGDYLGFSNGTLLQGVSPTTPLPVRLYDSTTIQLSPAPGGNSNTLPYNRALMTSGASCAPQINTTGPNSFIRAWGNGPSGPYIFALAVPQGVSAVGPLTLDSYPASGATISLIDSKQIDSEGRFEMTEMVGSFPLKEAYSVLFCASWTQAPIFTPATFPQPWAVASE